jgi:HK97 family phage prohead protease
MKDAAIKFTSEVEAIFKKWLDAPETKALIEQTQKAADGDTGTFEVIITTENLDRYQEVIKLDGWDLAHYRNNPVVLWGHDHHTLPVGVATTVEIADGKMVAKGKFAPHAFAQTIRQLYDMGVLRATSVGFIEKEREGNLITKAELLEFSFVSVPANPYALSLMVKSGVSVNEMVTKGFVLVEKDTTPDTVPEEKSADPAVEEPAEPQADGEPAVEEKKFDTKAVDPIIASLKSAIVALEALSQKDGEPEGDEPEEVTEEEKAFDDFSAKRKLLQDAATVVGDVLAEARKVVEAKR